MMYSLSLLATFLNTTRQIGYVTTIVTGILDSCKNLSDAFLTISSCGFAETPSRRHKMSPRRGKICHVVKNFLNIIPELPKNIGLPESIKNSPEVPRSAKKLFKMSPRSSKIPNSAHFLVQIRIMGQVP